MNSSESSCRWWRGNLSILLEVVAGSVDEALAAEQAGADRIELCSALPVGGLTPSLGMAKHVLSAVQIPVAVMLRSREGGFVPSADEFETMLLDAALLRDLGVAAFVFAVLDGEGNLDEARCRKLVETVLPADSVFHRAVDQMSDRGPVIESLIELGFCRLLTSGGAATAWQGAEQIRVDRQEFGEQIQILPGGGIRPENVGELVRRTGVTQVHFSSRRPGAVGYDGFPDPEFDAERVYEVRVALQDV